MEQGFQTTIDPAKAGLYTGTETTAGAAALARRRRRRERRRARARPGDTALRCAAPGVLPARRSRRSSTSSSPTSRAWVGWQSGLLWTDLHAEAVLPAVQGRSPQRRRGARRLREVRSGPGGRGRRDRLHDGLRSDAAAEEARAVVRRRQVAFPPMIVRSLERRRRSRPRTAARSASSSACRPRPSGTRASPRRPSSRARRPSATTTRRRRRSTTSSRARARWSSTATAARSTSATRC